MIDRKITVRLSKWTLSIREYADYLVELCGMDREAAVEHARDKFKKQFGSYPEDYPPQDPKQLRWYQK